VSFTVGNNISKTYYIPLYHKDTNNWDRLSFIDLIETILSAPNVAHNLNFELCLSAISLGIPFSKFNSKLLWDTQDMSSQVDENISSGLKSLTSKYLKVEQKSYSDTLSEAGASNMSEVTLEQVLSYGCDDSTYTARLAALFTVTMAMEGTQQHSQINIPLKLELLRSYIKGLDYDWVRHTEEKNLDLKVVEENMPKIKTLLSYISSMTHKSTRLNYCKDFRDSDYDNKFKLKIKAGKDPEIIKESLSIATSKFYNDSEYIPYSTKTLKVKVIKSITFLKDIFEKFNLPVPEKITLGYLEDNYIKYSNELFIQKLLKVRNQKKGKDWDDFEDFCLKNTSQKGKVVEHGFDCNLGSTNKKQVILYGILGSKVNRRSKPSGNRKIMHLEGSPSTDEGAFQMAINALDKGEELYQEKLDCLRLLKITLKSITRNSLFWNPYPKWKHLDGKLRPSFKVPSTRTRRPTGSSPNFLQLPQGGLVRGNVIAPEGYFLVAPDWSAEEMRLVAWESQCPDMLSGYIGDQLKDLHSITGSVIAPYMYRNLCPELLRKVKYVQRGKIKAQDYDQYMLWRAMPKDTPESKYSNLIRKKRAKNLNFLSLFSGTAYSAVEQLLIPFEEAEILVDLQSKSFQGLKPWQNRVHIELNSTGYMKDAFGQRYHYRKAPRKGYSLRELRQTLNNYSQGCATAILYETGKRFHEKEIYHHYGAYLIAPIYDELLCAVKIDTPQRIYECLSEIRDCMKITPPGHGIEQKPEFEVYLKGEDGKSRWAVNGFDLPLNFTLEDIEKLNKDLK